MLRLVSDATPTTQKKSVLPVLRRNLTEVRLDDGGIVASSETSLVRGNTDVLLALRLENGVKRAVLAIGEGASAVASSSAGRRAGGSNAGGYDDGRRDVLRNGDEA